MLKRLEGGFGYEGIVGGITGSEMSKKGCVYE